MDLQLVKALRLLDAGRHERAEQVLLELLASSEQGSYRHLTSCLILGELYLEQRAFERARNYLETVARAQRNDDVLDEEQSRARALLLQLEKGEV